MRTLETERLLLRPFRAGDLDEVYRLIYADPEVACMYTSYTTFEQVERAFQEKLSQVEGEPGWLAVVRKQDGRLIGMVALQPYLPGEDTSFIEFEHEADRFGQAPEVIEAELTYAFGRAYWGQGYATEACRAVIEYGFRELGVSRIVNAVQERNVRSVNLLRRLGFRIERNLCPSPSAATGWFGPGIVGILERRP